MERTLFRRRFAPGPASDSKCCGVTAAVGNADQYVGDASPLADFQSTTSQDDQGRAAGFIADFHVGPGNPAGPTGAKRLEHGFLGGPSACIVLGGRFASAAVLDLAVIANWLVGPVQCSWH